MTVKHTLRKLPRNHHMKDTRLRGFNCKPTAAKKPECRPTGMNSNEVLV